LYPNAKEAPLAPQGVTFENEEFGQEISWIKQSQNSRHNAGCFA
jgi:hypothetical protein